MPQPRSQINKLLVLVAILAVAGGLSIVIVTSPQSWQWGPVAWFESRVASPTAPAPTAAAAASETPTPEPSASTTPATTPPTAALARTATATERRPTETTTSTPTPTATEIVLPANVVALARVELSGASNGRVRNAPAGDTVIAVLPAGTEVYVLPNPVVIDGIVWVEVLTFTGTRGWMADFLLEIVYPRP
jgi:cytoskeletal protein RodZ